MNISALIKNKTFLSQNKKDDKNYLHVSVDILIGILYENRLQLYLLQIVKSILATVGVSCGILQIVSTKEEISVTAIVENNSKQHIISKDGCNFNGIDFFLSDLYTAKAKMLFSSTLELTGIAVYAMKQLEQEGVVLYSGEEVEKISVHSLAIISYTIQNIFKTEIVKNTDFSIGINTLNLPDFSKKELVSIMHTQNNEEKRSIYQQILFYIAIIFVIVGKEKTYLSAADTARKIMKNIDTNIYDKKYL